MKLSALLLAAGSGDRFFSKTPKQFHLLGDKKVYRHPLDLIKDFSFEEIVLIIGKNQEGYVDIHSSIKIVTGGESRQESVCKGLQSLNSPDGVIIFESVRPFITKELILRHIEKLQNGSIAINTCIPSYDTINVQKNGKIQSIPSRDQFLRGQTPQSFLYTPLLKAHLETTKKYTDDCGLMLDQGYKVDYVEGFVENIKITTPFDYKVAEMNLPARFS